MPNPYGDVIAWTHHVSKMKSASLLPTNTSHDHIHPSVYTSALLNAWQVESEYASLSPAQKLAYESFTSTIQTSLRPQPLTHRFANDLPSATTYIRDLAQGYMYSFSSTRPSCRSSMASNTALHGVINIILSTSTTTSKSVPAFATLEFVYVQLIYRTSLSSLATQMLRRIGCPLPYNKTCADFDHEAFERWIMRNPSELLSLKFKYVRERVLANVLPQPGKDQGWGWDKPHAYIAAGIACWEEMEGKEGVDEAIRELEAVYAENVAQIRAEVEKDGYVRERKEEWYESMGKVMPGHVC